MRPDVKGDDRVKKVYIAPMLEIERYVLNSNIAQHCNIVVHNGPEDENYSQCSDYVDPFSSYSMRKQNVNFRENCDCYTTGNDGQYRQS